MNSWFTPFTVAAFTPALAALSVQQYVFVTVAEGDLCSCVDAAAPTSFCFCILKPLLFVLCLQCILLT